MAVHLKREHDCLIAVDGTLYAKYPQFKQRMTSCLQVPLTCPARSKKSSSTAPYYVKRALLKSPTTAKNRL